MTTIVKCKSDLDTPCLVLDMDVLERNLQKMQAAADGAGIHVRRVEAELPAAILVPHDRVVVCARDHEVGIAVDCMKAGAFDYLTKPADKTRLLASIRKAMEMRELRDELSTLKEYLLTDQLEHESAFKSIITKDRKMRAIFQYVEATAGSPQPVLVAGDTGTGKELVAKAIHDVSGLSGRFVAVNVAGLDDTMFSDTLFGHEKGAYSGADRNRAGRSKVKVTPSRQR